METIHSFFSVWGGLAIAILGGALSAAICCAGSAAEMTRRETIVSNFFIS